MEWSVSVLRTSGTVVIPSQKLELIVMLQYLNQISPVITNVPSYAQGGGGGVLTEVLYFYL